MKYNDMKTREQLITIIKKIVQEKDLKQKELAKLFGISQPRISSLMKGKVKDFSVSSLLSFLNKFGYSLDFKYEEGILSCGVSIEKPDESTDQEYE